MSDEVYEGAIGIDLGEFVVLVCAAGMRICKIPLDDEETTVRQKIINC